MGVLKGLVNEIEVHANAVISFDLGRTEKVKWKVKFHKRTKQEAQAIIGEMTDPDSDVTEETILERDIISWRDLKGVDGEEVEFNPENMDAMLGHLEYVKALFEAWGLAQMGRTIAHAKN
jgi:hypothetical protein